MPVWILSTILALTWACAPDHGWTAEEIGNAEHVIAALESERRAAEIENLGEAGYDREVEREAALEHRQHALDEARRVRDAVLDKVHPALRAHFRDEFQRSLELFLEAEREGSARLENEALRLRDAFGTWYGVHAAEIRIPTP